MKNQPKARLATAWLDAAAPAAAARCGRELLPDPRRSRHHHVVPSVDAQHFPETSMSRSWKERRLQPGRPAPRASAIVKFRSSSSPSRLRHPRAFDAQFHRPTAARAHLHFRRHRSARCAHPNVPALLRAAVPLHEAIESGPALPGCPPSARRHHRPHRTARRTQAGASLRREIRLIRSTGHVSNHHHPARYTRIEGHARVSIHLDDADEVSGESAPVTPDPRLREVLEGPPLLRCPRSPRASAASVPCRTCSPP